MKLTVEEFDSVAKQLKKLDKAINGIGDSQMRTLLDSMQVDMYKLIKKNVDKGAFKLEKDLPFIITSRKYHLTWHEAIAKQHCDSQGQIFRLPTLKEVSDILECSDNTLLHGYFSMPNDYWVSTYDAGVAYAVTTHADGSYKFTSDDKSVKKLCFYIIDKRGE